MCSRKIGGIDRSLDHHHERRGRVELHQGADLGRGIVAKHRHLSCTRRIEGPRRDLAGTDARHEPGARHHLAGGRHEDHRLVQAAQGGLAGENLSERVRVLEHQAAGPLEVGLHAERVGLDGVPMFGEVALRGLQALLERRADPVIEPALDAQREPGGGDTPPGWWAARRQR